VTAAARNLVALATTMAVALHAGGNARGEGLDETTAGPATIGEPRPPLELDALDGSFVNSKRVAGAILVVDFFATWCQPCRRAHADLRTALQEAGLPGAQLLLVNRGESVAVARRWAEETALPPDTIVALDPDGVAARRWGASRLPTTFIVDAAGVVRHINRGWGPGYRARLSRWLRAMRPLPAP
jgi:cytochrome c biogenesis protein CcmG, thiol:disulfide interchange protein DsbE